MHIFYVFIVISAHIFCNHIQAGTQEELFLQANKLYQEEQFAHALELYTAIKNKGPAVWYNMGDCYYHMDNKVDAFISWNRAQKGADISLNKKIEAALSLLNSTQPHSALHHYYFLFQAYVASISLLFFQLCLLILIYTSWLLYRRHLRTKMMIVALWSLLLSVALIGIALYMKYTFLSEQRAVVYIDECCIYAGPNNNYGSVHRLHLMDMISIQGAQDNWYKIKYEKGAGWVQKDDICLL